MKPTISIFFVMVLSLTVNAQTSFGLRGKASSTWLLNKNLSDNGDLVDYKGTFTGGGGISVLHLFSPNVGLEFGIGTNTIAQRTQGEFEVFGAKKEYVMETSSSYLEIPILLKAVSEGGTYFEIGTMIGLQQNEEEKLIEGEQSSLFSSVLQSPAPVEGDFNSTQIYGILGFGVNIDLSEELFMGVGFRLGYGFTDSLNEFSEEELSGPNAEELGWYSNIAHTDAPFEEGEYSYESTNAAFAAFNLSINYRIGGGTETE